MSVHKCPLHKELQFIKAVLTPVKKLTGISRKVVNLLKKMKVPISNDFLSILPITNFLSLGTGVLFNFPRTIVSLSRVVTASTQAVRVQAIWSSISSAVSTFMDAANVAKAFEAFGVLSKEAIQWTSVISKVLYPVMCIGVGLYICDMKQFAAFYDKMKKNVLDKTRTEELAIENLTEVCAFIEKRKDRIYRHLGFSRNMVLDQRFKTIRETIQNKEASEEEKQQAHNELKKLLCILKERVHAKIGFNIASTAIKIASVASMGASVFGVTAPATIGASIALSIIDLVLYAAQKIVLPANPLDENIWQYKAIRWIKNLPVLVKSSFQQIASIFQREPVLV